MDEYARSAQHSIYTDLNRLHAKYYDMPYTKQSIEQLEADISKLTARYKAKGNTAHRYARSLLALAKADILSRSQYLDRFNHKDDIYEDY